MKSRRLTDKLQGEVQVSPVESDTAAVSGAVTIHTDSDVVRTMVAHPEQTKHNPTTSPVKYLIRIHTYLSPQTDTR